jgi:hypothetical protein
MSGVALKSDGAPSVSDSLPVPPGNVAPAPEGEEEDLEAILAREMAELEGTNVPESLKPLVEGTGFGELPPTRGTGNGNTAMTEGAFLTLPTSPTKASSATGLNLDTALHGMQESWREYLSVVRADHEASKQLQAEIEQVRLVARANNVEQVDLDSEKLQLRPETSAATAAPTTADDASATARPSLQPEVSSSDQDGPNKQEDGLGALPTTPKRANGASLSAPLTPNTPSASAAGAGGARTPGGTRRRMSRGASVVASQIASAAAQAAREIAAEEAAAAAGMAGAAGAVSTSTATLAIGAGPSA